MLHTDRQKDKRRIKHNLLGGDNEFVKSVCVTGISGNASKLNLLLACWQDFWLLQLSSCPFSERAKNAPE